jgi:hypothetical protein
MHTSCWWDNLKQKKLQKPTHRWKDNIKIDHKQERWRAQTGFIWLQKGSSGRLCVDSNKPMGSIKCGEFPIQQRNY